MITMRLVEELKGFDANFYIITGNGTRESEIFEELCKKYDGLNKILWFPRKGLKKKTGLSALDVVKDIPSDFGINQIIYTVDADAIEGDPKIKIQAKLRSIGINVSEINPIKNALFIRCNFGSHNDVVLYCIITGVSTCIEEEIAKLMKIKLDIIIDCSGERNANWRNKIKNEINKKLREIDKNLRIKTLVRDAGIKYLEECFPNICAVLKVIEKDC